MLKNIKFIFRLLSEKLWIRPLIFSLLSIGAAFVSHLADDSFIASIAPEIQKNSIKDLLNTISASMLVIAIFAVGAMLSAFSSASGTATPRSFKLVVADDVSQNALSIFIGSFIYSIVATIALQNGYYGKAGHFTLFIVTLAVFGIVIITFLRWVDRISKLGRLNNTISKVEASAINAMIERKADPHLGGTPVRNKQYTGVPVFGDKIGYVQYIKMDQLQEFAESVDAKFLLNCMPGTFTAPDKPLIYVISGDAAELSKKANKLNSAFVIRNVRTFHTDPRFGLIALSEIASRALSPGINDPGTAIAILGSLVRIFTTLIKQEEVAPADKVKYDRIEVPEISLNDMFDDAFRPIARDGAGNIEVMIRLQKAFKSIYYIASPEIKVITSSHARQAFERAESTIKYPGDLEVLRKESIFENTLL
jgi:uncharacterized membrane protein